MARNVTIHGDELYHFGIKGQKWGVRRYQNEDGSLTEEGKKRYMYSGSGTVKRGSLFKKERERIEDAVYITANKDAREQVNSIYSNKDKDEQQTQLEFLAFYAKNNPNRFRDTTVQSKQIHHIDEDFDTHTIEYKMTTGDPSVVKPSKATSAAWQKLRAVTRKEREASNKLWNGEISIEKYIDAVVDKTQAQNKFLYARMGDLGIEKSVTNLDSIRWIMGMNRQPKSY